LSVAQISARSMDLATNLRVGEARHLLSLDERCTVRRLHVDKGTWCVAHCGHWLALRGKRLDELDRVSIVGEVPERSVPTGVEHGVERSCVDRGELDRVGQDVLQVERVSRRHARE
jgi:hypothetical protein